MVRRAGEALLRVYLGEAAVHGSPFLITVQPGPTAASTSSAQGAGIVTAHVGVEAAFVITAVDAFGNRKRVGGDHFHATLHSAQGDPVTLGRCEVIDCEDGTYLGVFTPTPEAAGQTVQLHVAIGEVPIRDSPFAVRITPG